MYLALSRRIVDSLPEDPFEAIVAMIREFRRVMAVVEESLAAKELRDKQRYEIAREACALLSVFLKREGFAITTPQLPFEGGNLANRERERERERERAEAVTRVIRFMNQLEIDIQAQRQLARSEDLEEVYAAALGPALQMEFSEEELARIRGLLTSLRDLISISPDLSSTHRRRLLKRIERLVGELGRRSYDLSLFWGFVVEMSLVFRPISKEARLLAPTMKELMALVWSAQATAFGRPPDTALRLLGQDT